MRLATIVVVLLLLPSAWAGTCGAGYAHSGALTIAPLGTLANFPYKWETTQAVFKTVGNGGQVEQTATMTTGITGPADLILCDAPAGGNQLKHEVDTYSDTTGHIIFWVQVTLSATTPLTIYPFWGDVSVVSSQENLTLWADASYVTVYHGNNTADSTGNNNLTNSGATFVPGEIGSAFSVGDTPYTHLDNATATSLPGTNTTRTLEAWINANRGSDTFHVGYYAAGSGDFFAIGTAAGCGGRWFFYANGKYFFIAPLYSTAWHHYAITYTGGGNISTADGYLDGVDQAGSYVCINDGAVSSGNSKIALNSDLDVNPAPNGSMYDEIRISSDAKSATWLKAEYLNTTQPKDHFSDNSGALCADSGWGFTTAVSIPSPPATFANFPFPVKGTFDYLKTVGNGGHIEHTTGGYSASVVPADLVFCTASSGGTTLNYETDNYSPTTGAAAFWVSVPSIPVGGTTIYARYGNAAIANSSEHAAAVWSAANYISVYHFGDGGAVSLVDSGPALNNLLEIGATLEAGMFGGAVSSAGSAGAAVLSSPQLLPSGTDARTLEAWINPSSLSGNNPGCAAAYGNFTCGTFTCGGAGQSWAIQVTNGSGQVGTYAGIYDSPDTFAESGSLNSGRINSPPLTTSTWWKVLGQSTLGNSVLSAAVLTINGRAVSTGATANAYPISTVPTEIRIGACLQAGDEGGTTNYFSGAVDEVRVSSDSKSAAWNAYEYCTDSGDFTPCKSEEPQIFITT